jgi:Protein of unknown function (DUF3750)
MNSIYGTDLFLWLKPNHIMAIFFKRLFVFIFVIFLLPLAVYGPVSWSRGWAADWSTADWSSAGVLPAPRDHPAATIRVYTARAGRWKGIFAVHSWIVIKRRDGPGYDRYDVVGWGRPVRKNNFAPDGRWYGNEPELVYAVNGRAAEKLIPKIEAGIAIYPYARRGDYLIWPGPNSNTFVASVMARIPEIKASLPPTALGRDYPVNGQWFGWSPSRTGIRLSFGGMAGITIGWVEGIEFNLFGLIFGVDIRHPALKLPGFGRIEFT